MSPAAGSTPPPLHRLVFDDVRRPGIARSIREDLFGLNRYYLDEEQRARLAGYGRFRGALVGGWWLLKSLLLRLSPARRVLLFAALVVAFLFPDTTLGGHRVELKFTLWPLSVLALLALLMLELRDKLVARDEIEVARAVQLSLLPRDHPGLGPWTMWSATAPANDVGGDLVDYVPLPGRRIGVVLGDVAGKGMGAALLCAKLQATLRALAPSASSLAALGDAINAILVRDGLDNRFATLFYAEIVEDSGVVRYVNAGHNPAIVVRAGRIERLPASSRPLGMLADSSYVEGSVELADGDALIVFSDGVTEAVDLAGSEFGDARVVEVARTRGDASPESLGRAILEAVEAFTGGAPLPDDRSIVVVRLAGRGPMADRPPLNR